jgi:serine/threonine-protein kinase
MWLVMSMRHALPLTVLAVAVALSSPAVASAQAGGDVARADALFNAAKALLDGGRYADACAKFAESNRLVPGLGVTLYLADCYERIGKLASAWSEFRSAEGLARERNDKRAEVARARAQAIEPKLTRLTIAVGPTVPRMGLQVLLDGAFIPAEEWGLAMAVDPGERVVSVAAPGHSSRTIATRLGPDNPNAIVRIDSLDEPSAPPPPPQASPAPESVAPLHAPQPAAPPVVPPTASTGPLPPSESASITVPSSTAPSNPASTQRWVGVGVGVAGLIGVGVGAGLGISAKSKLDQSNNGPCGAGDRCTPAGLALRQDASSAATGSTVAFVIGGIAVAAGVVVYLTAPRGDARTGWTVAPAPVAGGGGAILAGSF